MHKVLLVDDESWVVESLKDLVEWDRYGFEVVGQASNGGEALEAIERLKPDVVFTDIRMPEMNGLELIRRGKLMHGSIHYVVVSGYAEFAYAQKALSYGAVAFCLKPFDENEIGGVLNKINAMMNNTSALKDEWLQLLLDGTGISKQEKLIDELTKQGVLQWIQDGVVPIVAIGSGELPKLEGRVVKLKTGTAKTVYLMSKSQAAGVAERWNTSKPEDLYGIGVGERVQDLDKIKSSIEGAGIAAYQFFITGRSDVYTLLPPKDAELNELMLEVKSAVGEKNSNGVHSALDRIDALFREGTLSIRHAFQVYNMTISFLFNLDRKEDILYSSEQLVQSFAHVQDMLAELRNLADRYLRQSANPAPESKNQTFNAIVQFVTDNYRRDLSLQDLSDQFFMNPSYISQLFKKEVGETFTAYVARLRIANACELLEHSEDSIQEIAEKNGYHDYFYFARLFKKLTGKTPTQYREG